MDGLALDHREYPQTWLLIDVVDRSPRLVGQEVVDLSPGAIELRHVARELRQFAAPSERWLPVGPQPPHLRAREEHHRALSFGPTLTYWVERDETLAIHGGRPFQHLAVRFGSRILTPATAAEIGLYFYGRRPAIFAFTAPDAVHGYVGLDWDPVESHDVEWLLQREMAHG